MEKREVRTMRTALRRAEGQVSGGPSGVWDQSRAAISRPSSPPPSNSDRTRGAGTAPVPTPSGGDRGRRGGPPPSRRGGVPAAPLAPCARVCWGGPVTAERETLTYELFGA